MTDGVVSHTCICVSTMHDIHSYTHLCLFPWAHTGCGACIWPSDNKAIKPSAVTASTGDKPQYRHRGTRQTAFKTHPTQMLFAITATGGLDSPLDSTGQHLQPHVVLLELFIDGLPTPTEVWHSLGKFARGPQKGGCQPAHQGLHCPRGQPGILPGGAPNLLRQLLHL